MISMNTRVSGFLSAVIFWIFGIGVAIITELRTYDAFMRCKGYGDPPSPYSPLVCSLIGDGSLLLFGGLGFVILSPMVAVAILAATRQSRAVQGALMGFATTTAFSGLVLFWIIWGHRIF
jgi:hypothetical protein